ncbi:MAG: histidine kinase [Dysgonomonas sp.]|nr:histidine kinase [Dysgonomonas sp.]
MKKYNKKNIIIALFWTLIMIVVWFSDERELSLAERLLCFSCFSISYIGISIAFSKTLFKNTFSNKKIIPFIAKFVLMTSCFLFAGMLLHWFFYFLETSGFITSNYFIEDHEDILASMIEGIPGLISTNLLFGGILLYYEYTELKNINLKYQLQILHSQINPHFMFNVLNHIYILMQKDVDMASSLLLKYSDALRYQLYSGKNETAILEQEVQFLKNYIDVEKFRWEGKLDVTCSWNIENNKTEIAPLLLITFIENAFKHVSRSQHQKGFITISLVQQGNTVTLEVKNSKSNSNKKKEKDSGIGLANVKARLDILYPKRYTLTIDDEDETYLIKLSINV